MRSTRTSSGTWKSRTLSTAAPFLASMSSSILAWGTVRGNPSRMKPFRALRLLDGFLDNADDDVIRDERTRFHRLLRAHAVGCLRGDRSTEHVPCGKVAQAVIRLDFGGLGSFSAPRGAFSVRTRGRRVGVRGVVVERVVGAKAFLGSVLKRGDASVREERRFRFRRSA